MADTREQVAALNGAIRDRLVADGTVDDRRGVVTDAGERLGVGDRVMTRRNDRDLGVANRDTWTITGIDSDGTLTLYNRNAPGGTLFPVPATQLRAPTRGARLRHHRPRRPRRDHPHRPPAPRRAHLRRRGLRRDDPRPRGQRGPPGRRRPRRGPTTLGGDLRPRPGRPRARSRRHAARPRTSNATHPIAPSRPRWRTCVSPGAAELDPSQVLSLAARAASTSWPNTANLPPPGPPSCNAHIEDLRDQLTTVADQVRFRLHEPAIRSLPLGRVEQEHADWLQHIRQAEQGAQAGWETTDGPRPSRGRPPYGYPGSPERGRGVSR